MKWRIVVAEEIDEVRNGGWEETWEVGGRRRVGKVDVAHAIISEGIACTWEEHVLVNVLRLPETVR
jgi:hypothetical protein